MRTSLYSILCIVIRLGAIVLAIETLVSLPNIHSFAGSGQLASSTTFALYGLVGLFLLLAGVLWIYPGVLARMATSRASQQVFDSPLEAGELQYIAFSIVGVVFAISALGDLLGIGFRIVIAMSASEPAYAGLRTQELARAAAAGIKFVLGLGLTFGARGLVGWVRRLREHGLPVVRPDEEATPDFQDPPHPP